MCFHALNLNISIPTFEDRLEDWWIAARVTVPKRDRQRVELLISAVYGSLWKQRNARVSGNKSIQCNEENLAARVLEDMKIWQLARGNRVRGVGILDQNSE